jgi:hypothetical protein
VKRRGKTSPLSREPLSPIWFNNVILEGNSYGFFASLKNDDLGVLDSRLRGNDSFLTTISLPEDNFTRTLPSPVKGEDIIYSGFWIPAPVSSTGQASLE